ncbi:MAG: hypothetical protein IGQ88_11310 [Gloeomargaritaceae cyanobacterium C42_A2020_066]|nr:hypothetical protein [Gloeomargaritaceae cyanobacterium C42_A2020_066]
MPETSPQHAPPDSTQVLFQAVATWNTPQRPAAQALIQPLLILERQARLHRHALAPQDLQGTWRLVWITGTQKARRRLAPVLGAGRYLPKGLGITLTYDWTEAGTVANQVCLGPLSLTLSGPAKLVPPRPILAFDFTQVTLAVAGRPLITRPLRGGPAATASFYTQPVQKQAFFVYFWVTPQAIAARGRGGGLALWVRQDPSPENPSGS